MTNRTISIDSGDRRGDYTNIALWKVDGTPKVLFSVSFRPLYRTLLEDLNNYGKSHIDYGKRR